MERRIRNCIIYAIMALLFVFVLLPGVGTVHAAGTNQIPDERQKPRVVDDAALLNESEEKELLAKLDEISERQMCDVAVVTVESLEGKTSRAYADDFYDYNGYGMGAGDDGILLLISMENRDWAITTHGTAIQTFTDAGQAYMVNQFKPALSSGDYAEAFMKFAQLCDEYITQAADGLPYDTGNLPKQPFPFLQRLGLAFLIGAVLAFFIVTYMKAQLKSVRKQDAALEYEKQNSFHLTNRNDFFLYRNVSRRKKPEKRSGSSTHTSSSGRSHGGSSGHF